MRNWTPEQFSRGALLPEKVGRSDLSDSPRPDGEGDEMAKQIDCPCGATVTGDTDDELVSATEAHISEKHPDMVGTKSREEILAMAHDV